MSDKELLFEKPVGVLTRKSEKDSPSMVYDSYGPEPRITITIVQNGFKIGVMEEYFVAKTSDEAKELVGQKLDKMIANLQKNDKK
jgi:hypothetical protein